MSFEKSVLEVVGNTVGIEVFAKFEYGTLFVECTPREASKIETALLKVVNCGVIVSPVAGEFAFDFT